MSLSPRDHATFGSVAETMLPTLAPLSDLPASLDLVYADLPSDSDRSQLSLLLGLMGRRSGGLTLYGRPVAFSDLDRAGREAALRRMFTSRVTTVRQGAQALKALTGALATGSVGGGPAVWSRIGYPGPDSPRPDPPPPLDLMSIDGDTTLSCDVVVVGSGAGGGPAAAILSSAGLSVIVVEKGGFVPPEAMTHDEVDAYGAMYLDRALGATADKGILMLAGSTLGGGTAINYTTALEPPQRVLAEWDRLSGFGDLFRSDELAASLRAVSKRMSVGTQWSTPSPRDQVLERGARHLGWHVGRLPRNVVDCDEAACGFCTMGCRIGAKQSSSTTWLADASRDGARILTNAEVTRVESSDGQATGVTASVGEHRVTISARAVIVAAGALSTPGLLMRSGVSLPALGRYLRLHPVTVVWGRFDDPVDPWSGMMQASYCDEFVDLDGDGYGVKFETAPVHPLLPPAFHGFDTGDDFEQLISELPHWSPIGILSRDRNAGRVKLQRDGRPSWTYRLGAPDLDRMRTAVHRAAELLAAAGATEVRASAAEPCAWKPGAEPIEQFVEQTDSVGYGAHQTRYVSFHQMGSARMGTDPYTSVVDSEAAVHGFDGLYVMDGSLFPTASGVNPMLTISALAHRAASRLASRL